MNVQTTELAASTHQPLVSKRNQEAASTPSGVVRGRLKRALDAMVWEGLEWNEAAAKVNFTTAAMRKALQRASTLAYLKAEREVLRASVSAKNIHRLAQIRDAADNMPAVNAIKALEQIGEQEASSPASQRVPGFIIQVITQNPGANPGSDVKIAQMIEGEAKEECEP